MNMRQTLVDTAIIPMSGFGTRMLPIGKAIEKSMLPIWNRPVIDYVLDEAAAAGIKRIIFVINSDARTIQQYFGSSRSLEKYLVANGKTELLRQVQSTPRDFSIEYVVNDHIEQYGTANVVWQSLLAMPSIPDAFVVLYGDCFCLREDGSDLNELLVNMQSGGYHHGVLGVTVAEADVSKYGILNCDLDSCLVNIVEKPSPEDVSSRFANIGHYVFSKRDLYPLLKAYMATTQESEYLLTDVISQLAGQHKVLVQPIKGEYLDAGNPQDLYKCWQRLAPSFVQ